MKKKYELSGFYLTGPVTLIICLVAGVSWWVILLLMLALFISGVRVEKYTRN